MIILLKYLMEPSPGPESRGAVPHGNFLVLPCRSQAIMMVLCMQGRGHVTMRVFRPLGESDLDCAYISLTTITQTNPTSSSAWELPGGLKLLTQDM